MYCISQTGSLPRRLMVDVLSYFQHWIKEGQFTKKKVSTLFLNVKHGFYNINYLKSIERLESSENMPKYLTH